jgi:cytoskeletal protein RodZ
MSRKRSRVRERVGAKLKKARERNRISLRQVADATKISVSVLQALERDDISYLPGGVVGRGFVRSFAAAVHLDPEAIVAEFLAQFPHESVNEGYRAGSAAEETEHDSASRSQVKIRLHSRSPLRIAAIGVVSAALAVFGYFAIATPDALSRWTNKPFKTLARADSSLTLTKSVSMPVLVMTGGPSMPSVAPLFLTTAAASSTPEASSASTSGAVADVAVSGPLKLTLSARAPSWVIASVDGKKMISRLMEAGELEDFEAAREVVVTAGDGSAISMTLNGTAVGSIGRTSKSVTVRVNHTNLETYLRRGPAQPVTLAQ